LSQSKRYSVAILTATVLSGHCGAAECFSVTSKMAAIKQRLAMRDFTFSGPFAIVMVVVVPCFFIQELNQQWILLH
ncbi:hypothetical protein T05_12799, partial [Trichinella murrelli]